MKYHNITTCDMLNGDGLRVVLWVSGCEIHCPHCQNPETWNPDDGVEFDDNAKQELFDYLEKDYISGITFSGGHPLHSKNIITVKNLILEINNRFPDKTIWLYTGYKIENLLWRSFYGSKTDENEALFEILTHVDIIVDGPYVEKMKNVNAHWVGSDNQRVINMNETIKSVIDFISMKSDNVNIYKQNLYTFIDDISEKCIILHNK